MGATVGSGLWLAIWYGRQQGMGMECSGYVGMGMAGMGMGMAARYGYGMQRVWVWV